MVEKTKKALYVKISGRVQGVGFRYSTLRKAQSLALKGYVRNLPDGCVETVAEGRDIDLQTLIKWLEKGPPGSYVEYVNFRYITYTGTYRNFTVTY